jgi:flagellar brake protein
MFLDTQPASLGADGNADAWSAFRVENPVEAQGLLRQLRDGSVPVNLAASDGTSYTTTLWSFDAAQGRITSAPTSTTPSCRAWSTPTRWPPWPTWTASSCSSTSTISCSCVAGSPAHCRAPRTLYRFQRRGAYRVRTLERGSPTAHLRHPSIPDMSLALRVLDVSIGGCALLLPADVPPLQPGTRLEGVRVDLDADTRFEVAIQMHHVSSMNSRRPCAPGLRVAAPGRRRAACAAALHRPDPETPPAALAGLNRPPP